MYSGGDAAEQVVRLSLEGFDVAARLTGSAAKNVAVLLAAALKEEHRTKGKTRLTTMLRSGKELKVFSIPNKDLPKFVEQAKRYGVLYCLLKDKEQKDGSAPVDIIARAEDASKIQRIFERFQLGVVDKASVAVDAEKDRGENGGQTVEQTGEQLFDELVSVRDEVNPTEAVTEKGPLYAQNSGQTDLLSEPEMEMSRQKPSVKAKLDQYWQEAKGEKEAVKEKARENERSAGQSDRNHRKKPKKNRKKSNRRKER